MSSNLKRNRLETKAIILGYAMSRLDTRYLDNRNCKSWKQAFEEAALSLAQPSASFKNLRDEFDPIHQNLRQGWHQRPLRANRQKVADELQGVSDDALMELVSRILRQEDEAIVEAVDSLAPINGVAQNVAERLLTGRLAEEFFVIHSKQIVQVETAALIDYRQSACGFDFGVQGNAAQAIEVKGMKTLKGNILFTDREWSEAKHRGESYWVVVVGNLREMPTPRVIRNPHKMLMAKCTYRRSVTAEWHATVNVQS